MIDVHAHILYGVDDGSKDEAMSLELLRKAAESGTQAIFATSHVLQAGEHPSWQELQDGVKKLQVLAKQNALELAIYSGAEVFMDWDLLPELAVEGSYCLNGEQYGKQDCTYILVELPMHFLPAYADDFWYELRLKGVQPILAHPERYPELMAKPERLLAWRKDGLLLQCNAGSFAGYFGKAAQQAAKLLLQNGLVDLLGSDAHRPVGRDTDMRAGAEVISKISGAAELERIAVSNPQRLVSGQAIEHKTPAKFIRQASKKSFWRRFFD